MLGDDRDHSREVREEIRFYLRMRAEELERSGMEPAEAWEAAVEAFGDPERVERQVLREARMRAARGGWAEWIGSVAQDARVAARAFGREPGFTAVAVVTLGLGIGATSAIFSVADQALLSGPPIADAGEVVAVYTTSRRGAPRSASSYPDFRDYRSRTAALEDLAATSLVSTSLADDQRGARLLRGQSVTGNFFELLGLSPAVGRLIDPADDEFGGGSAVVVLSHALWQDRFGGDPDVVGTTVRLGGQAYEVIGVAPRGYLGLRLGVHIDLWIPIQTLPYFSGGKTTSADYFVERGSRWIDLLVGRLADGASAEQAYTELFSVSESLREEDPDARGPRSVTVDPMAGYILPSGRESDFRLFVALLGGTVGLAMILCCASIANLLLARASARTRDASVRLAIGAGRLRLVRQLLTESLLLAMAGGATGVAVASGLLALLGGFDLPGGVGVASLGVTLDLGMVAGTAALALGAGILFGTAPALFATRADLAGILRSSTRDPVESRSTRARKALVAAQVALCVVLLVGSGLFVRTLREGLGTDLGFEPEGLALTTFYLGFAGYGPEEAMAFASTLEERAAALPGVRWVSTSTRVPLQGGGARGYFFTVEGYQAAPDEELRVDVLFTTPGHAAAVGLPVLAGRDLADGDGANAEPVTVVSRSMAERYWPSGGAVGGIVSMSGTPLRVVGVVENATWSRLGEEATNYMYLPLALSPSIASDAFLTIAARTEGDAEALLGSMRALVEELDREVTISRQATMVELVAEVLMPQRLGALLLTTFGFLALVLSSVSIAGVVAYAVNRRRREIGVRVALGASNATVQVRIARSMGAPVLLGLVVGVVVALGLSRLVEAFLFGVRATDPGTYLAIMLGVTVVAAVAAFVPARAALRVQPSEILKAE
jgi:predicted permease